jgi:predicted nucleic acid-binding protein
MKTNLKRKNYYLDEKKIRRVRAILQDRPNLKSKLPALVNDCLRALSARSLGATLYTGNRDDFMRFRGYAYPLSS